MDEARRMWRTPRSAKRDCKKSDIMVRWSSLEPPAAAPTFEHQTFWLEKEFDQRQARNAQHNNSFNISKKAQESY